MRPTIPAMRPCRSDSLPSVAETCFWLMTFEVDRQGAELICFASVSASPRLKLPSISAPFRRRSRWGRSL